MKHKKWLVLLLAGIMLFTVGCTSGSMGSLEFTAPDAFQRSKGNGKQWMSTVEGDRSNILWGVGEKDSTFDTLTAENVEARYEATLEKSTKTDVDIIIDSFERTTIDDARAIEILMHCELDGQHIEQLQYMIEEDYSFVITFTQINDADWMDEFRECVKTIKILEPNFLGF